jgi:probable HAF family extracellular repeat protein
MACTTLTRQDVLRSEGGADRRGLQRRHRRAALAFSPTLALMVATSAPVSAQEPQFEGLGDLPGGSVTSSAAAISANGLVVVGRSTSTAHPSGEAYRWTATTGMVGLGVLGPSSRFMGCSNCSQAFGVSADGSVIVGQSSGNGEDLAFRWTETGGMVSLGDLPGGSTSSFAAGVSADGSVVVGIGSGPGYQGAWRWTQETGMVEIGGLLDIPNRRSSATGISADGLVIVGISRSANADPTGVLGFFNGGHEAFRWTAATGMVGLGDLPGGIFSSSAGASNLDGSVIVGWGTSDSGREAFRWTAATGMVGLGDLPGGAFRSSAAAVSANGAVVVGSGTSASGSEAFRWTAESGMQSVKSLLEAQGVDMTGWTLSSASGITANGITIVGTGTNPSGITEVWISRYAGLSTPQAAAQSVLATTSVADGLTSWLDQFSLHVEVARHHRCEGPGSSRICGFAYGEAARYSADGAAFGGTAGIKVDLGDAWSAGVSARGGTISQDLAWSGSYDFDMLTGQAFLALMPKTGLQVVVTAGGGRVDGEIERGYMNGAGTTTSHGETSGRGLNASAHIGWALQPTQQITLTPFAYYTATKLKLDGWTETSGPFPAMFDNIDTTAQRLRLGVEGRYEFSPQSWFWASAAWGHRFEDRASALSGELIDLFSVSTQGRAIDQNWIEGTVGLRLPVAMGAMTTSTTVTAFSEDRPDVQGRIGYSLRF